MIQKLVVCMGMWGLILIPAQALGQDYNVAKQLESRCKNALDSRDFEAASVFCMKAAEEWGVLADSLSDSEPAQGVALIDKGSALMDSAMAARALAEQRESVFFLQSAMHTFNAILAETAQPSDVRAAAKHLLNIAKEMMAFQKSHPV